MLRNGFSTSETMGIATFPMRNMKIVNFLGGLLYIEINFYVIKHVKNVLSMFEAKTTYNLRNMKDWVKKCRSHKK